METTSQALILVEEEIDRLLLELEQEQLQDIG
jgi:hypothetical protein